MKNVLVIGLLFFSQFVSAQLDFEFTPSGDRFKKAYEHLMKEEYVAAFEYFNKVNPSDTLYEIVRFNKLIYQYSGSFYKDAVKTGDAIIKDESVYSPEAYYYKIKALIDLGEFAMAESNIQNAKVKFPLFYKYDFLKALVLKNKGNIEKAKKQFQILLKSHPKHAQSHYELAVIMAEEAAGTEAILGFQMAIISNRNSSVLQKSFVGMEDVMQNNFDVTRAKQGNKLFKKLNNFISSEIGLKDGYKAEIDLKYFSNNVTDLIFQQLSPINNSGDFTMDYYGKFLHAVKNKNLTKGYTLYLLGIINNPIVQKYVAAYKSEIAAFEKFQKRFWNSIANENKQPIKGKTYKREYDYDDAGNIIAVGRQNEKEEKVGPWIYFYPSGEIAAQTNYNEKGNLQGKNIWFARDGYIKESGFYEDGKITGHAFFTRENGTPFYEGPFKENKAEGELTFYSKTGVLSAKKMFKENEVDGDVKEYYLNGTLASKVFVKGGKNEGSLYIFSSKGDTSSIKEFQNGKAKGKYISRHLNGNTATEGQYKSGKRIGRWIDYYYNGKIKYLYNYKNGSFHGTYLKFDSNGDTLVFCNYVNGELNGPYNDYSNNLVLWRHDYKNGKLKKYSNFSPQGILLNDGKKNYNLNDKFGFKYIEGFKKGNELHGDYLIFWKNGNVKEKRVYEKGVREGEHKEYFSWGDIEVETNYKEGGLHGVYKSYYDNGEIYCEGYYYKGEEIGLWKFYHPNGNLKKSFYYSEGESIGHHVYYSIQGEKNADYYYKGDVLYKTKVFNKDAEEVCTIKTPQGNGEYNFTNVEGRLFLKSSLDGGKHHGKKQFFYPNGKLKQSVEKKHGESHGKFQSFYVNGQLKKEGMFVFGVKQGEWKSYHYNGKMSWKGNYIDDYIRDSIVEYFLTGEVSEVSYFDTNGNKEEVKYMHPSGKVNSVVPFDGGFIHGNYSNYDGFGNLVINRIYNGGENVSYSYIKNGKLVEQIKVNNDKPIKTFYENGKLASEYKCIDGLFEGNYKRNHSNGKPWIETTYMHDNVHGFYKSYYADGTIRYEAEYENGRLNGKMKKFSKKGRILEEVTYVFGVKHGKAQYYNKDSEFLYALIFKDDVVVKVE